MRDPTQYMQNRKLGLNSYCTTSGVSTENGKTRWLPSKCSLDARYLYHAGNASRKKDKIARTHRKNGPGTYPKETPKRAAGKRNSATIVRQRPHLRYRDISKRDMKSIGIDTENLKSIAEGCVTLCREVHKCDLTVAEEQNWGRRGKGGGG